LLDSDGAVTDVRGERTPLRGADRTTILTAS
jgi:hypothetical protein